jgi:hypothetical protein
VGCLLPLPVLLFVIPQRSGGICCLLFAFAFAFAPALAVAVACSFVCHSAAQRRNLLFAFASALTDAVACSFVCHSAAQRRNLLFAFAVAVACLFSISSQKTRHLDRSNGRSHRLLRSGEIRFCLRPRF